MIKACIDSINYDIIRRNLECFGEDAIRNSITEEFSELIQAICKSSRDDISRESKVNKLLDEIGDCYIALANLAMLQDTSLSMYQDAVWSNYEVKRFHEDWLIMLTYNLHNHCLAFKQFHFDTVLLVLEDLKEHFDISDSQVQSMIQYKQGRQVDRIAKRRAAITEKDNWED